MPLFYTQRVPNDPPAPSSDAGNASHPQQDPETPAVRVDVVRLSAPEKERGRWVTTVGTVVVPALALVAAIIALVFQHESNQASVAAANRANVAGVSFLFVGRDDYEIINLETAGLDAVYVQPTPGHLDKVGDGTIHPCSANIITLTKASNPAIYFTDEFKNSWRETADGPLLPSVSPSAIFVALPGAQSALSQAAVSLQPTPPPNCS